MPRLMEEIFRRFEHVIGYGHVSGLSLRRFTCRGPVWRCEGQVQINTTSSILLAPHWFS